MQLKKQCLFALILISFISCDLLFDKDMQEKSAGLLDKIHSTLGVRNQAISNTSDKPNKLIKRPFKKIKTKRKKGMNRGKVNTQASSQDNRPISGVYDPSVNDVLVSDPMTQETLPKEERENLPIVTVSDRDLTSLNSQEGESKPELTIPTVSLSGTTGTLSDLSSGGYSGDYEYTYYSIPTTISGYASPITEEVEDSPQYEYYDQLEKVEKKIDSELETINKIKKDRDQVEFQATMSTSGHSTSDERKNAKEKLNQFSKEKLAQTLQTLFTEVDDVQKTIENILEDYYEVESQLSKNYVIELCQTLAWAKGELHYLIKTIEGSANTFKAYSIGIGHGSDFSQVETILKKVKELLGKAKNEINLTFKN
ncbi:BBK32 immunogenic protein P35 (plasmid) [Borrelia puertoricensis]|uniref:BBK32 immunogenic protein P35 n=1 Tax=Borrelia puertoricensis TaxID=2756107 RepID=UPI001FF2C8F4|nr:BBK32 immunogenic protein P35 [Borrelia puertoricensis]UPA18932.1 BBK32 immunogenic protein P35 [Borrelia puertoricensis]